MSLDYKLPSEVRDEYLLNLKALKPSVNTDQTDSDWWIRASVLGGVVSGLYADQTKVAGDIFPQSARSEAVDNFLELYGIGPRRAAEVAEGTVGVTGTIGTVYSAGVQFEHTPTGNIYIATTNVTLTAATGTVPVSSQAAGQNQNLLANTPLTMPAPPSGHSLARSNLIQNGRNEETTAEAAARVIARIQQPIAGGTESDYQTYALDADPSVTSAAVARYIYGPGTVGVYITAGTTDIDAAIDAGLPVIRIPSAELIEEVEAYVKARVPITDCPTVLSVAEVPQDVTVNVSYISGLSGSSVLSGQTLTLNQLVQREIERCLYKIPSGGRRLGASGYVLASEIEEAIDSALSASPYAEGSIAQVILDRQLDDLTATSVNRVLTAFEIVSPGTITVNEL